MYGRSWMTEFTDNELLINRKKKSHIIRYTYKKINMNQLYNFVCYWFVRVSCIFNLAF